MATFIVTGLSAQWGKKIKGNGEMVTIERSTGDYESVAVSGWFDIELIEGSEGEIKIHGEENLLEHIITEVKDGTLEIKVEKGVQLQPSSWKKDGGIFITVPVEEIEGVALSGSGDITSKKILKAERFSTSMSGSGNITLEVETNSLETSMSGSGDIDLRGKASRFDVRISGSGDVQAFGLEAEEVEATVSGSADIEVTVHDTLIARVSGSGDIRYKGDPKKVDSKSSGSGDISKG